MLHRNVLLVCAFVICFLGIGLVTADSNLTIPDRIRIETRDVTTDMSKEWIVATGTDTIKVSVWAVNTSLGYEVPLSGLKTTFALYDSSLGTINPTVVYTNAQGRADSIFTTKTKSGSAVVGATVYYDNGSMNNYTTINIDHNNPYSLDWFDAPDEDLVGKNVTVKVHYRDQYNNSIDNRRFVEYVTFSVTSPSYPNPSEQAGFWNGSAFVPSLTAPLDSEGVATVLMRMDTHPGINRITVHPQFSGVSDTTIQINGIADIVPVVIEQQYSSYSVPDPYPNIPADNINVFTILYTLRDQYGNGVPGARFWMNTTLGESQELVTNATGQVKITYGPKTRTGLITITATAQTPMPDGTYASNAQTVEVISTEPVQMVLMANPQLLPSWDVPAEEKAMAEIRAVVMDRYGNPVKYQPVSFTIGPWNYNYASGNAPKWSDSESLTIQRNTSTLGYAVANFQPGFFPGEGYPAARDNCTITAQWASYQPQTAKIQWTNVPFLSIKSNVSPSVAGWNDTVTVNIKVAGDGYALRPKPVDVVLLLDTSLSMQWNISRDGGSSNQRIKAAKNAAKIFISNFNPSKDKVGLVTFSTDASLRHHLTTDFSAVNSTINGLFPNGYTNMRNAYKLGIDEIAANGRYGSVKAVILLSDGEWNNYGSPVAHGTGWTSNSSPGYTFGINLEPDNYRYYEGLGGTLTKESKNWKCYDGEFTNQNMSRYAAANNIRLYNIFFASNPSQTVNETLGTMARATGGFYDYAPSEQRLNELFEDIAGRLQEEAGVGVTMDTPFNDITISSNTSTWSVEGKEVFSYLPYTDEWKYWDNSSKTTIYRNQNRDDSSNWSAGNLNFTIGTILLDQAWEITYRLKVLPTPYNVGKITLFDENSIIRFSDGKQWYSVSLPTTIITGIGGQAATPVGSEEVGYEVTNTVKQNTLVTKTFNRNFKVNGTTWNGNWYKKWYEEYFISIPGYLPKTKIGERYYNENEVPREGSFTFDIRKYLPPGVTDVTYNFYVEGTDGDIWAVFKQRDELKRDRNRIFIFLE
ncbi:MAG: VWA domain-containing protein [Methanolinea tarda]|jgi:hypothetical protein